MSHGIIRVKLVFCQSIKYNIKLIKQNYSYFVDIFYFKDVCIGIHKMGQSVSYGVNKN